MSLRCCSLFFGIALVLSPLQAATKYEGGTAPIDHGKLKVSISGDQVVLTHGSRKVAVTADQITALSCDTESRKRFGAAVLGVVHLDTAEQHFIGLSWTENDRKTEAVLRLSGGQYRSVLAKLERLTGKKAVDTGKVPTIVQYGL